MKKKPKEKNIYIGMKVPKSIQKAINKQCRGLKGYKMSIKRPIPKQIVEYFERIRNVPEVDIDWFINT